MRWLPINLLFAVVCPLWPAQAADASRYLSKAKWQNLFKHTGDSVCSPGFYTYEAFAEAVKDFPQFATSSTPRRNRRELAAFLAQISAETTGGWPTAPDGPWSWGLCFTAEGGNMAAPNASYCAVSSMYPCAHSKKYYGRGPVQLTWNFNYGPAGQALGVDLLADPDLVVRNAVVAFKTALWFWNTPRGGKPSCHEVMAGLYTPTAEDRAAKRKVGFGWTTNIINGNIECGRGGADVNPNRLGFFREFSRKLRARRLGEVSCTQQMPYPAYA